MDLVAPKKDLVRLVAHCQGVADKKSTMPALANVLVAADADGTIRVAATDLFLSVSGRATAEVRKPGSVAIPARDVLERIKAMPEGPVQLTSNDSAKTELKSVGAPRRYTVHGMPGHEFPLLPSPAPDAPQLELPVDVLARLIQRTIFSVSPDETRVHVNSALFEWSGDSVRMVTTDGHRLSKAEESGIPTAAQATMLIPLRALHELRRLCDEARSDGRPSITISQAGANAFFSVGDTQFSAKLVDASFPPYKQVIPQSSARSVTAPRLMLAEALKAVSLASSDRTGAVKLALSQGVLRITSESPESGNGFDEISVDYSGPDLTIGFNAKYFLDVFGALDSEQVVLSLSGELDPAVLTPATGPEGSSFVGVIMPMRI